jgi:hypothetical protein
VFEKELVDCVVMWTRHLPPPRPAISEEVKLQKRASGKKMPRAFQLRNNLSVPVGGKKKQKIKNGNPELPTICEDVPPNRSAPAPTACEGALPASVPSPDTGIKSSKKLAYEDFPVINWEAVITSGKNDVKRDALNVCNHKTEDLKEKDLQLEKKLQILLAEKEAMQLSREELEKKLALSEARLLESSSQLQQTSAAMRILQEELESSAQDVLQLKSTLEELRSLLEEPSPPQPPAGPSAAEQRLEEEARQLRKALECLEGQLEAQVRENDRLSRLKEDQERQLLALEQAARIPGEQAVDGKEDMKSMENQETLTDLSAVLKEQLAQLQHDNMKLTSALLEEQNVKKKLVKKLGHLQENLDDLKVIMEVNSQEAPSWQEEGVQCLCHQQEDMVAHRDQVAANQKPTGETEAPKDCLLEVMAEDLEPQGVPVGAIGECTALSALLKEIEDKKAETICMLPRQNGELTWELQDLKFQLDDQCKMWQGKFWQSPTAVLLGPPQRPMAPRGNVFCFLNFIVLFKIILLVYLVFIVTVTKILTVFHS